ncbi:efflux RND transporter permease subunit [Brachybacterium alimentarium]|uniref:Multidrug transporter n=1 Tax=Brachybacterium alimentarium TaxID=47845 RepID=A0A2A3YKE8_9MICO|nr:efflux RND transporter permease subunit [Brachybacterium alimentarium]PCC39751.1 multidrug transporter [Brachybacterium alimentarium]RCS77432.1 AcrB/AcrD/AcrF family protein [Brachybacterium alimentarium]RCS78978.1 AcrB/AcrD/AcrF family protein [Brachybacterium alimentarium]RCS85264.1 AcrB/AcrD/AcrF family protein [Brachybacterium alimentarium]
MNRLARLSLNNRSFIALVCIAVSIIGAFAMTTMRQELIPSVSLPQVQVMTSSPGSSSEQVQERISRPVEQAVSGLENVESTSSTSQAGVSIVTVELTYGTDTARSSNQIEAALSGISDDLPEDADPDVMAGGTSDLPAVVLSVSSDLEPSELGARLDSVVTPDLERVDGVSSVAVIGAPEEIVQITPDEAKLAENGLTEDDISTALDANGLSLPGGSVTDGDRTMDVVLGQSIDSLESLEGIMLMPQEGDAADGQQAGQQPSPVALSDVATVERTTEDPTSISRTDGRESLVVMVTATADGNVVDISDGVDDVLADALPGVGGNAESAIVFDQAPFIQESILALAEEGLLGLVFAVGVILLFLRRVRPTVVTAISIPTSLLIAFIGMLVTGYTLNMLTLAALTISIGRVVDDSIVVIENIMRHLAYGKTRMRAILDAVGEVAGAITASTLATVVVFLPIAIVSGMAGELFRPFALTVGIAMLSSLLVALTIVPVLAYWFLRAPKSQGVVDPDDAEQVARIRAEAEATEERSWLHRLYAPLLRLVTDSLPRRLLTVGAAILVLVGTAFLYPLVNVNFLGDTGQNIASLTQSLPAGTSLEQSEDKAEESEQALMDLDGVETVQTTIGGGQFGMGGGGAENEVSFSITTDPDADQTALQESMVAALEDLPDAGTIEAADVASPTGSSSIDILITGPTAEDRKDANDAILAELDPVPSGVTEVTSDLEADKPTAVVTVDREKAAQLGLTEEAVIGMVAGQMYPGAIGTVTLDDTELSIYVEQGDGIETFDELTDIELAGGVPLTDVASIDEVASRPSIATQDSLETVTVSLAPDGENVSPATEAANAAIEDADLPEGVEASVGGTAADIDETFGQLGIAMLAAILLVYVLLVWIFKSLIQPLILLVSIPFAATGALGLLIITGVPLGLPSMIGLLMLVGIVVTNAIVLIDLVNQYRRRGMGLDEALHAGAAKRLRPILMTAAATIFALLPMALGITGNGGFIAQPLAVVVIGGLISSTLLTLLIVPVLYRLAEGPGERRRLRQEAHDAELRDAREQAAAEKRAAHRAEQERQREAAVAPEEAQAVTAPDATGPDGPGHHGRRRSLKERGGIVGVVRRRFRGE